MSSTKVKKLPFMSDKPYDYDYDAPIKNIAKRQQNIMWLAKILLGKEFESVEYVGLDNVPTGGSYIICANHVNGFDPINLAFGMRGKKPEMRFMAKSEFFQAPYVRALLMFFGGFPVKRDSADLDSIKYSVKVLESGKILVVFPQGTRDRQRTRPEPETAFPGAMMIAREAKKDILPVSIHLSPDLENHHPKCVVRYGEMIPYEDLGFTEGKRRPKELKAAMDKVMTKIGEQWDLDTDRV